MLTALFQLYHTAIILKPWGYNEVHVCVVHAFVRTLFSVCICQMKIRLFIKLSFVLASNHQSLRTSGNVECQESLDRMMLSRNQSEVKYDLNNEYWLPHDDGAVSCIRNVKHVWDTEERILFCWQCNIIMIFQWIFCSYIICK